MRWRLCCICVIVPVTCWAGRHFLFDDGLIYARYVQNALHGNGMVFNAGERVNALTSPLFAVLLLGASWVLQGHVLLAALLLFGIFFAGACAVAEQLVPWAGVFVASTGFFYYCIGMETSLFLLMLSLLTFLYVKGRIEWIPLVAMLTVLSRFEGLALVGLVAICLVQERRRPALWAYLPALMLLVGYLYFNHAFYGSWLPSSVSAKVQHGRSGCWGRWPTAFLRIAYLGSLFRTTVYVLPLGVVLGLMGIWKERWSRMNRVLLPFGLILGSFYVLLNVTNYHWYYAPFVFFIALYAIRGVPRGRIAEVCLALAICECFGASIYLMQRALPSADYIAMGTWIRQNTQLDAHVAAVEIGTLSWYDDRYTDDLLGLTNPGNATRVMKHDWTGWIADQHPDYVVIHKTPAFGEIGAVHSADYGFLPVHFGSIFLMKRKDSKR